MELITGSPGRAIWRQNQPGGKRHHAIRTGRNQTFWQRRIQLGLFRHLRGSATIGFGTPNFGNFIALNAAAPAISWTHRNSCPSTTSATTAASSTASTGSPARKDVFHLDLFTARNWFQVPNDYDQLGAGSEAARAELEHRARISAHLQRPHPAHRQSLCAARSIGLLRQPRSVRRYAGHRVAESFPDELRRQGRYRLHAWTAGNQNRTQIQQTRLVENFQFGITDPTYNPVCLDSDGIALLLPGVTNPDDCSHVNPTYVPNPNLQPGILPYDLTRGGSLFYFHAKHNINEYAFYLHRHYQARQSHHQRRTARRSVQRPGLGQRRSTAHRRLLSDCRTNTVLRASYARTLETPFNENLLLSSATGSGGLARECLRLGMQSLKPGNRNQFNTGFQQGIGKWLIIDADYFWKYTHNAYDFTVLFNTPITFPIAWHNSKAGWRHGPREHHQSARLSGLPDASGHTRARFFPPEVGGLISAGRSPHQRLPDRSRSGLSANRDLALPAPEESRMDRFHLAL